MSSEIHFAGATGKIILPTPLSVLDFSMSRISGMLVGEKPSMTCKLFADIANLELALPPTPTSKFGKLLIIPRIALRSITGEITPSVDVNQNWNYYQVEKMKVPDK